MLFCISMYDFLPYHVLIKTRIKNPYAKLGLSMELLIWSENRIRLPDFYRTTFQDYLLGLFYKISALYQTFIYDHNHSFIKGFSRSAVKCEHMSVFHLS